LEKIAKALPSIDMPCRVRAAEKTRLFPAEKTDVMIPAFTRCGRTGIPNWSIEITYGELFERED
jgi:hypothetical protein